MDIVTDTPWDGCTFTSTARHGNTSCFAEGFGTLRCRSSVLGAVPSAEALARGVLRAAGACLRSEMIDKGERVVFIRQDCYGCTSTDLRAYLSGPKPEADQSLCEVPAWFQSREHVSTVRAGHSPDSRGPGAWIVFGVVG